MNKRRPQSRRGGATVLVIMLLSILLSVAFWGFTEFAESLVWRRGLSATEAAARTGAYVLHPMEYTLPADEAPITEPELLAILQQAALANGLFPGSFQPLQQADIVTGPISISVLARPRYTSVPPMSTDIYGIPAARISEGRQWFDSGQVIAATGCLPIGIQIAEIPDLESPAFFTLPFGANTNAATVVQFSSATAPIEHIRFLGFTAAGLAEGIAPPSIQQDGLITLNNASPGEVTEIQDRFTGRLAVVPLLNGNQVVRFARIRIGALVADGSGLNLTLQLAPSALVRSALPPSTPPTGPAPLLADVPEIGMPLRPWRPL